MSAYRDSAAPAGAADDVLVGMWAAQIHPDDSIRFEDIRGRTAPSYVMAFTFVKRDAFATFGPGPRMVRLEFHHCMFDGHYHAFLYFEQHDRRRVLEELFALSAAMHLLRFLEKRVLSLVGR